MAKKAEGTPPSPKPAAAPSDRGPFPQARLLAFPEIKKLVVPGLYTQCLEQIIPHFLFPPELEALFQPSDTTEIQVRKLDRAFQLFPDDFTRFIAMVKAMREKEESLTLSQDAAIRAYG